MPYNSEGIGYQGGDTSRQAAEDLNPKAETVRRAVLMALKQSVFPMSSEQIANFLEMDYGTVQPRTAELRRDGLIRDSGIRVRGRFGKLIIAWELGR